MEYSEKNILLRLNRSFLSSPKYLFNNLYIYKWESDYLAITRSMYAYEIEIKISVSDFKNDFKKRAKHEALEKRVNSPNYFFYICPEGMIKEEDIPDYAGLLYIGNKGYIRSVKPAPRLHSVKFDVGKYKILDKCYYNYWNYKNKYSKIMNTDLDKAMRKKAAEAAEKVRESAVEAFKATCPFAVFSCGDEYPECGNEDIKKKFGNFDCILQCERGRKFLKKLK